MKHQDRLPHTLIVGLAILSLGLPGCGKVVVFGHTVHEGNRPTEVTSQPDESSDSTPTPAGSPKASENPVATSQSQSDEKQPSKPVKISTLRKVKLMPVVLEPKVAAQIKDDPKFNIDDLQSAITAELRSQKVLAEGDSPSAVLGEITIEAYELHRTSNVVLFGKRYYDGVISGVVRTVDAQGKELGQQRINAGAKISIPEEGDIKVPLDLLYKEFARQLVDVLTGVPAQPVIQMERPR